MSLHVPTSVPVYLIPSRYLDHTQARTASLFSRTLPGSKKGDNSTSEPRTPEKDCGYCSPRMKGRLGWFRGCRRIYCLAFRMSMLPDTLNKETKKNNIDQVGTHTSNCKSQCALRNQPGSEATAQPVTCVWQGKEHSRPAPRGLQRRGWPQPCGGRGARKRCGFLVTGRWSGRWTSPIRTSWSDISQATAGASGKAAQITAESPARWAASQSPHTYCPWSDPPQLLTHLRRTHIPTLARSVHVD